MNGITVTPTPINEPVRLYAPGSPERDRLAAAIKEMSSKQHDLHMVINNVKETGNGPEFTVVSPQKHQHVLGKSQSEIGRAHV